MPATITTESPDITRREKVLVGMSGGLDSTISALLLREQGYDVEGAAIIMHDHTDIGGARRSAEELGVALHIIDARERFKEAVMRPFAEEYMRGLTPNPCVFCNPAVKFAALHDYARAHGFHRIATGHYAFVDCQSGRYFIRRAASSKKDLARTLTPRRVVDTGFGIGQKLRCVHKPPPYLGCVSLTAASAQHCIQRRSLA